MSKAKFAAARELIQEKHYDAARAVLQTMDNVNARQWLQKLDQIAPSFPGQTTAPLSKEQERFFRQQNRDRKRKRIGNGLNLILMGIACFVMFAFFAGPELQSNDATISLGFECFLLPLGVIGLIGGFLFIFRD